jgi:hypothetical protein
MIIRLGAAALICTAFLSTASARAQDAGEEDTPPADTPEEEALESQTAEVNAEVEVPAVEVEEGAAEITPTAPSPQDAAQSEAGPPSPHLVTVQLGFSHWYGGTFGAPIGTFTPALIVGLIPIDFIEIQLSYTVSVVSLELPDASDSHVGFLQATLLLRREIEVDGERLSLACGFAGGIVHTHNGVREAFGGAIVARYLIGLSSGVSLGPFIDVRAVLYELPESSLPIFEIRDGQLVSGHSDAQVQIGVALAI